MKVYFYCSYNLSPVGYQKVFLDPATGEQGLGSVETEAIETLLTHGGAKSALGLDGSDYYFVIKGMKHTEKELSQETPGRGRYLNLGLAAPAEELESLLAIACLAYTHYKDFTARLAACVTPQDGEVSYTVDLALWERLAEDARKCYAAFRESGEPDFSDAPCGLGRERLAEALELIRGGNIRSLYEFALLEGDAAYFRASCGCNDVTQPVHWVELGDEAPEAASAPAPRPAPKAPESGGGVDPKLVAAGLVLGALALGTVAYGAYQAGKLVGKLHRRSKK